MIDITSSSDGFSVIAFIEGNKMADELARTGSALDSFFGDS